MTSPQTIAIAAIDEDRKYWRMVIRAIGEDPLRIKPGNLKWLIARYAQSLRQYSPNAKGNFQFERVVIGWRGTSVLDLRLKR